MRSSKNVLPFVGMVISQCIVVGTMIAGKAAMSSGMTNFTFVSYSNAIASLILLPSSFLIHRLGRPPITFYLLCAFFLLALLGCTVQVSAYAAIQYTSPAFASAMLNLIPGFTFIIAIILRMEKLDCKSSSIAKSIGTVVSIIGAFVVTLYKGPSIMMTFSHSNSPHRLLLIHFSKWIIGGLILAADSALSSLYGILVVLILRKFPAQQILIFFYCSFVAILSAVVALIMEADTSAWSLQPNIRLIAVLYSGIIGTALQFTITAWCLHSAGALFVAMFQPLGIVIATVIGIIFLGDTFYLGSLVGSIVIVIGFYAVMWGKFREGNDVKSSDSTIEKAPLLQNNGEETEVLTQ
ncbi:WAT1-related protein At3g28050-like [Cornus florida]|uniref:WAT1-related protein At3g28050-like n=1 Tax=Cornus florida TaxID=4283 RepID=UPI00289E3DEB|nr:WAT1-related protein At3g28050-like [Cornus florida]